MPEYLAPGVYVEETSFRPKTIEGVSTSTAGFVGPARFGPTQGEPELLTSFTEFERLYGGLDPLEFGDAGNYENYLAHAVRAFFEEGGKRCYVARVELNGVLADNSASPPSGVFIQSRFPGAAGNMRITFTERRSDNLLILDPLESTPTNKIQRIQELDTVYIESGDSMPVSGYFDVARDGEDLVLEDSSGTPIALSDLDPATDTVSLVTVDVSIERPVTRPLRPSLRYETLEVLEGFSLNPNDARSLAAYFNASPRSKRLRASVPFTISVPVSPPETTGAEFAAALFNGANASSQTVVELLVGGMDGDLPGTGEYQGTEDTSTRDKSGLLSLEDIEDISIVAAPGYSFNYAGATTRADTIQAFLISHCERMRYRIAVLDSADGHGVSDVLEYRGKIDSRYAALYYPWVRVVNPITGEEIILPPSGFMAGIYARNDVERGVQKAPANEVVRSAIGFEFPISTGQQEVLNPEGVNCLRFFEGRGYRVWGARTATSDGEWKYVNLRRYFAYLERSIDKGTQVFVFESNGDRLWANVSATISSFLLNEWKSGRLFGLTPEEAFFVRCDRTTMTQNDIDNGRLICLIGVAPLRPAEFVIFRIGQKLVELGG